MQLATALSLCLCFALAPASFASEQVCHNDGQGCEAMYQSYAAAREASPGGLSLMQHSLRAGTVDRGDLMRDAAVAAPKEAAKAKEAKAEAKEAEGEAKAEAKAEAKDAAKSEEGVNVGNATKEDDVKDAMEAPAANATNASNATNGTSGCATRKDERADGWLAETSPEGTPCVFGVDPRDEGTHCIYENGDYGSNGFCWTSEDKSAWGSCNGNCPLYGPPAQIGKKIDGVAKQLHDIKKQLNPAAADAKTAADEASEAGEAKEAEAAKAKDAPKEEAKKEAPKEEAKAKAKK